MWPALPEAGRIYLQFRLLPVTEKTQGAGRRHLFEMSDEFLIVYLD
jgi:hypothetical protein